ncbi:MAG: FISUMP domain-containing protein [Bacteroidota bacterium]|nr:FISUMP domain-containing protein [Bacteroidota bacterium]
MRYFLKILSPFFCLLAFILKSCKGVCFSICLLLTLPACQKDEALTDLSIQGEIKNTTSFGGHDGSIHLLVSGGCAPYLILWDNGDTSSTIKNITAGLYSVTVNDSRNGAKAKARQEFTVLQPDTFTIGLVPSSPSKPSGTDGRVKLELHKGNVENSYNPQPYTYKWSNGATTQNLDNVKAGTYSVSVTDTNQHTRTAGITVFDPVADIDGNVYTVTQIGNQTWMAENLKVSHTPDGQPLTRYFYDNNAANGDSLGALYTWQTAMNGSTVEMAQGICPAGWHIPSDDEWKTLEIFLGMSQEDADKGDDYETVCRGLDVDTKLLPGSPAGFNARYAGFFDGQHYNSLNKNAYFWTSTSAKNTQGNAYIRMLGSGYRTICRGAKEQGFAFSVRCIKN